MKSYNLNLTLSTMLSSDYRYKKNHAPLLYNFYPTPFGSCLLATLEKKIAYLSLLDNDEDKTSAFKGLQDYWQHHKLVDDAHTQQYLIGIIFNPDSPQRNHQIAILIKGTPFQLKVWQELINLPFATTASYEALAHTPTIRSSARGVGTALARNKLAVIIPCHRIILKSGQLANYYWGKNLKTSLLAWESSYIQQQAT